MSALGCLCVDPDGVLKEGQHFSSCPEFPSSRDGQLVAQVLMGVSREMGVSPKVLAKMANAIFNPQVVVPDDRQDNDDTVPYELVDGVRVRDRRARGGKEST